MSRQQWQLRLYPMETSVEIKGKKWITLRVVAIHVETDFLSKAFLLRIQTRNGLSSLNWHTWSNLEGKSMERFPMAKKKAWHPKIDVSSGNLQAPFLPRKHPFQCKWLICRHLLSLQQHVGKRVVFGETRCSFQQLSMVILRLIGIISHKNVLYNNRCNFVFNICIYEIPKKAWNTLTTNMIQHWAIPVGDRLGSGTSLHPQHNGANVWAKTLLLYHNLQNNVIRVNQKWLQDFCKEMSIR